MGQGDYEIDFIKEKFREFASSCTSGNEIVPKDANQDNDNRRYFNR